MYVFSYYHQSALLSEREKESVIGMVGDRITAGVWEGDKKKKEKVGKQKLRRR